MPKFNHSKTLALCLGSLALIFSLNYLALAWTEPAVTPPGDNVFSPINVGSADQDKIGGLGVHGIFSADGGAAVNTGLNVVLGKVGIGINNPSFSLQVESNNYRAPIQARTTIAVGGVDYKSGAFSIIPTLDRVYLAYGCYTVNSGGWYNDPFEYPAGTINKNGAKFAINKNGEAWWSTYITSNVSSPTGTSLNENKINAWNQSLLWDRSGNWAGKIMLPESLYSCDNNNRGRIEYRKTSATESHFYGCTIQGWKQLDQ